MEAKIKVLVYLSRNRKLWLHKKIHCINTPFQFLSFSWNKQIKDGPLMTHDREMKWTSKPFKEVIQPPPNVNMWRQFQMNTYTFRDLYGFKLC